MNVIFLSKLRAVNISGERMKGNFLHSSTVKCFTKFKKCCSPIRSLICYPRLLESIYSKVNAMIDEILQTRKKNNWGFTISRFSLESFSSHFLSLFRIACRILSPCVKSKSCIVIPWTLLPSNTKHRISLCQVNLIFVNTSSRQDHWSSWSIRICENWTKKAKRKWLLPKKCPQIIGYSSRKPKTLCYCAGWSVAWPTSYKRVKVNIPRDWPLAGCFESHISRGGRTWRVSLITCRVYPFNANQLPNSRALVQFVFFFFPFFLSFKFAQFVAEIF